MNKQQNTDFLLLYKTPISQSVLEYATDNFTKNNAKKLVELNENKNKNELIIVIKELIDWYEKIWIQLNKIDLLSKKKIILEAITYCKLLKLN